MSWGGRLQFPGMGDLDLAFLSWGEAAPKANLPAAADI